MARGRPPTRVIADANALNRQPCTKLADLSRTFTAGLARPAQNTIVAGGRPGPEGQLNDADEEMQQLWQ